MQENEIDLFDKLETLPKDVLDILAEFGDEETYDNCAKLVDSLNKVGYTCEYYLDAIPFNLRKLTDEEIKDLEIQ